MKRYIYVLLLVLTACGKEGMPKPIMDVQQFSFTETKVALFQQCVVAQTTIIGDYNSIESVYLELQSIETDAVEFSCPITPNIAQPASYSALAKLAKKPTITIQYCPKRFPKGGYRVRIRGDHYLYRVPYVFSPLYFISTKEASQK